jgi:hypothetical protein
MTLDFRDLELTDEGIIFAWSPGLEVHCQPDLQDDRSYAGACTDENHGTGQISMVRPGQVARKSRAPLAHRGR